MGEKGKRHYVFIKDFNTFMYDHTLHRGRKKVLLLLLTRFKYNKNIKMPC